MDPLPCVVCARVADRPAGVAVPPAVGILRCVGCDAPVYAAASTRRLVAACAARPVCKDCVPPGPTVAVLTAAGLGEFLAGFPDPEASDAT